MAAMTGVEIMQLGHHPFDDIPGTSSEKIVEVLYTSVLIVIVFNSMTFNVSKTITFTSEVCHQKSQILTREK